MRCSSVSAAISEKVNKQPAKMIFISSPPIDSPAFLAARAELLIHRFGVGRRKRLPTKRRGGAPPVRAGPPGPAFPVFVRADRGVGCGPGGPPHETAKV